MPSEIRAGFTYGDEYSDLGSLLKLLTGRPPWHRDGLCVEHPEVSWFPTGGASSEPAKALCRACLVRGECQTWAAAQGPGLQGVWGGLSGADRRRLRNGEPPIEVAPRPAMTGDCACCQRPVPGSNGDRLRGGLCEACYRRQARQAGRVA